MPSVRGKSRDGTLYCFDQPLEPDREKEREENWNYLITPNSELRTVELRITMSRKQ